MKHWDHFITVLRNKAGDEMPPFFGHLYC